MMLLRLEIPLFISLMVSWVSGQECGNVELSGNHGVFTSPNYPGRYEHKSNCNWTITAPKNHFIQITFNDFDVKNPFWDCDLDFITVYYDSRRNEKLCNYHKPTDNVVKSTSNTIKLQLISDHFFLNGVGFSATYDVVDRHGNKLEEPEKEDEEVDSWDDEETGQPGGASLTATLNKFIKSLADGSDEPAPAKTTIAVTTTKKPQKGRKGRKGKKPRKSKEERRRERRLRRQKEKALRKNKKGKGQKKGKKERRAARRRT